MGGGKLSPYLRGLFILVLAASLILNAALLNIDKGESKVERQMVRYPLLAKRIFLEDRGDVLINFAPLRSALELYLSRLEAKHSLYFEYLFTGTSVRQGDDVELVAASLMKVPIVMELYKVAELGRINIDQEVVLKTEWLDSDFGRLWQKGAGYRLTLRKAAELAMVESDNTATRAIYASIDGLLSGEEASLGFLDVPLHTEDDATAIINARAYASFLKCLYFTCYLSHDSSQEILDLLSRSTGSNRIAAGTASGVAVAHKIGSHSDKVQSDCGIVYVPHRNYILCIMLAGPKDEAEAHMREISRLVYDYVADLEH